MLMALIFQRRRRRRRRRIRDNCICRESVFGYVPHSRCTFSSSFLIEDDDNGDVDDQTKSNYLTIFNQSAFYYDAVSVHTSAQAHFDSMCVDIHPIILFFSTILIVASVLRSFNFNCFLVSANLCRLLHNYGNFVLCYRRRARVAVTKSISYRIEWDIKRFSTKEHIDTSDTDIISKCRKSQSQLSRRRRQDIR